MKYPFVADRTFETALRATSGLPRLASAPIAPAFDTATASSGLVAGPCGASKIGYFRPNSSIRAFARWVGSGIVRPDCEASNPDAPTTPNIAPAAAVVLMNSRLVPAMIPPHEHQDWDTLSPPDARRQAQTFAHLQRPSRIATITRLRTQLVQRQAGPGMGLWKASDEVPDVWSSTRNQSDRQWSQIGNGKSASPQEIKH